MNTFTFGNDTFLLAQIFDILKIWRNLLIVFQTLQVFMSSALTFKFMTAEFLAFPWAFPVIQKSLPFNVNLWQVIGPKIKSFCKIKPCEAVFVGKKFLIGHKQRHPILAQLLLSHKGILRIEIFRWASDNFFDSLQ